MKARFDKDRCVYCGLDSIHPATDSGGFGSCPHGCPGNFKTMAKGVRPDERAIRELREYVRDLDSGIRCDSEADAYRELLREVAP